MTTATEPITQLLLDCFNAAASEADAAYAEAARRHKEDPAVQQRDALVLRIEEFCKQWIHFYEDGSMSRLKGWDFKEGWLLFDFLDPDDEETTDRYQVAEECLGKTREQVEKHDRDLWAGVIAAQQVLSTRSQQYLDTLRAGKALADLGLPSPAELKVKMQWQKEAHEAQRKVCDEAIADCESRCWLRKVVI